MNKPLKDWTLGEVQEFCNGRPCDGCVFAYPNFCRLAHYHYAPKWWDLTDPPRFTEQEVEDARAILRLWNDAVSVTKRNTVQSVKLRCDVTVFIDYTLFPSIKPDETVKLSDIIGGE